MKDNRANIAIIGAGPSGLACAYTLAKQGVSSVIFEKDSRPGGLCKTINFQDYLFDIGGHRFLSRDDEVNLFWKEILPDGFNRVKRLSRIYYNKKFFKYPLSFWNTFLNLGLKESVLCVGSYFWSHFRQSGDDATFEGWITNRFGERLYKIFFDTYTEKVWAVPCKDLSADWATQRIQGLSLRAAIKKALGVQRTGHPKTMTEEFLYPSCGPGEFYDRLCNKIVGLGSNVQVDTAVEQLYHIDGRIAFVKIKDKTGFKNVAVDHVFSSMPLPQMINSLTPSAPKDILIAANKLSFRSFIEINIVIDQENIFPDQWIYIHSPHVKLGRIQNYKNWSKKMVPDSKRTTLGLEYFCDEGDEIWSMNDIDLIDFAVREIEKLGIVSRRKLITGMVVRCPNVYPLYTLDYQQNVVKIRNYLKRFCNLQAMGRCGTFRYDNSDRATLTGIHSARALLGHEYRDIWSLSTDNKYLEG
jgi:protoporphyrinogen oxidase